MPSARAAACTSRVWLGALGLAGLMMKATMVAAGTSSCSSSSRFGPSSTFKMLMPVTLPPGRLRLVTSPSSTGSNPAVNTIGIVAVVAFAAGAAGPSRRSGPPPNRRVRSPARAADHRPTIFDGDVLAGYEAGFGKALAERRDELAVRIHGGTLQDADHRHRRLLRVRRKRPSGRAAEQREEFATAYPVRSRVRGNPGATFCGSGFPQWGPRDAGVAGCPSRGRTEVGRTAPHSLPSSAVASTVGGIAMPSSLAVLRLTTNSNLIGCSTGRSAGLAPLRILSTERAEARP